MECQNLKSTTLKKKRYHIQTYFRRVYGWMSCGLLLTAFVAWYITNTLPIINYLLNNRFFLLGLCFLQFGLVLIMSNLLNRLSGKTLTTLFMFYSALTGLTTAGIFSVYNNNTIFTAFITTSLMFLSMCFWGYFTKKDLSYLGNIILMGIFGVIIASFINFWLQNNFLLSIINYIGVVFFTLLIAYDTQKLKGIAKQISLNINDKDNLRRYAILGALMLYLDFINLFFIILNIINNNENNENNDDK
ncbi:BAX inhibitor (BI)-1/YccA family protein [Enterobacteriaceae endosymbiont of Donacia bicoloricornis]|uniref:Bax inhibitor-1/YccA family protein n=1 Tax=Enterobacteriaceae endosymbiont of Donacia bicoloricornis TaxID=2675772 RepID=UPI001448D98C|nr:Bax inhibitor-1/YccA family protein [Enterobacteriaceae endosymbiont of Donacia bicoloricornis]QJC37671.1 BAX inhibitor (BI)-1/YccA family protein [Enterobacteriaceae endosymbiont of Donacia bicoloricornis]